jgi:hypothetical protein
MKVLNFTPHPITVVNGENEVVRTIQSSGLVRLKASTVSADFAVDGIPVTKTQFGEPEGLPEFEDGVFYIVSQLVKSALPSRKDLLVPAEVVRDASGNILGCRSLGI